MQQPDANGPGKLFDVHKRTAEIVTRELGRLTTCGLSVNSLYTIVNHGARPVRGCVPAGAASDQNGFFSVFDGP